MAAKIVNLGHIVISQINIFPRYIVSFDLLICIKTKWPPKSLDQSIFGSKPVIIFLKIYFYAYFNVLNKLMLFTDTFASFIYQMWIKNKMAADFDQNH